MRILCLILCLLTATLCTVAGREGFFPKSSPSACAPADRPAAKEASRTARSLFLPADTAVADSLGGDTLRTRSLPAVRPRHRISADSLGTDSLGTDTLRTDSVRVDSVKPRKAGIDSPVEYQAADSMVYDAHTGLVTLYGKAQVNYLNMQLDAAEITMNMDSSLVHAQGRIDSTKAGGIDGKPVYKQGSDQYDSERMSFNFKTKKGFIQNVYTAQGNGFLQSQDSKRTDDGTLYIEVDKEFQEQVVV